MQAISRVRHPDKYQCVLQCIEKEEEGWECIQPITFVDNFVQQYVRIGKNNDLVGKSDSSYWEAVYRKKLS